ncbi:ribokinase [Halobacillus naozhouensis]|uniref:Ribokinase n=1 Tax=Halobacillus naozhouensis TaxID=554880 RepID=A0ABY8IVM2_9BACI|nr:ribokinase [Halobacillus naozhouensis]WFT74250.1 ribokinase [Halobacillus naozhouensis]
MSYQPTVTVVGSINMDLVVSTDVMPLQGETVLGNNFATYPGGKGANQAVAAARMGANVNMIGAVGGDIFGRDLLQHLHNENIDTTAVHVFDSIPSGTATIILSEQDNRIIVAPGTNGMLSPELVQNHKSMIKDSDVILLQLEIPIETISYVASLAYDMGIPVILNPAPYQKLPSALLSQVEFLTPNETEASSLLKDPVLDILREKMIITQGDQGVVIHQNESDITIPGYKVPARDTTGAGDTFNGALATQLAKGKRLEKAVMYANAAAAMSVTKLGAQSGMPMKDEVEQFLQERSDQQ